jgi:hypothetical protein
MLDPHREIQALVDNFVADLSELAKRIAIEQVKVAFGVGGKLAAAPASNQRVTRARRAPREIEALRDRLLAAIAQQPGLRTEDLNAALGTRTSQIGQPLRRLVAQHLVRTEGARRGTRYFAIGAIGPSGASGAIGASGASDLRPPARLAEATATADESLT